MSNSVIKFLVSFFLAIILSNRLVYSQTNYPTKNQPKPEIQINNSFPLESFINLKMEGWHQSDIKYYLSSKAEFKSKVVLKHQHILFLSLANYLSTLGNDMQAVYKECGINTIANITYSNDQSSINMQILSCKNDNCARSIFSILKQGSTCLSKIGDITSQDDNGIWFTLQNYYIAIKVNNHGDEFEKKAVQNLSNMIARNFKYVSHSPSILNRLPVFGMIEGSQKIVCGNNTIQYTVNPVLFDDVKLTGFISGVTCDYRVEEPYKDRVKILLLEFKDKKSAITVYDEYLASLVHSDSIKQVKLKLDKDSVSSPVQDNSYPVVFKIDHRLMLCQTGDNYLLIIKNAKKTQSLLDLSRMLLF